MLKHTFSSQDVLDWQEKNGLTNPYPGHPVINACLIMDFYESLDKAKEPFVLGYMSALTSDIPGSGCAVNAAMDLLSDLSVNREYALQRANEYWENWIRQSPQHNSEAGLQGILEAQKMKSYLIERFEKWQTPPNKKSKP